MEWVRRRFVLVLVLSVTFGVLSATVVFTPVVSRALSIHGNHMHHELVDYTLKTKGECDSRCYELMRDAASRPLRLWQEHQDVVLFLPGFCLTFTALSLRRLVWLYRRFVREAAEQGVKKPSLLLFFLARDMDYWLALQVEAVIRQEREQIRKMSEELRAHRLAERRGRRVNGGVQSTDLDESRRRKIEELCRELVRITPGFPPDQMEQTQEVCAEARALFAEGQFHEAKHMLTLAYADRRELNRQQKVVTN